MAESENICKNPWKIYGGGKFVNQNTFNTLALYETIKNNFSTR